MMPLESPTTSLEMHWLPRAVPTAVSFLALLFWLICMRTDSFVQTWPAGSLSTFRVLLVCMLGC